MKKIIYIIFIQFLLLSAKAGSINNLLLQQKVSDTTITNEPIEDSIIAEVLKTKAPPQKEKVQYFSQVTKYGFKNLFAQYNYNPSLPYSAQVNPNAESYMQDYLKLHSNQLVKMKGWGQPYFNLIDNILSQYGLPRELKYLAVIESNLSSGATSWKGAGGPWQFMPHTARDYGLVVNNFFDERRDYYKSTHAAARYLLTLYSQMHDWLLVIAAYNGGPGRVYDAIKKSGSRNFWSLQYYLPTESRNHVKKFIATHYIMEGSGGITTTPNLSGGNGISADPYAKKPNLTEEELAIAATQSISGKYNSLVITKNLSMDIVQFNRYNPDFDNMMAMNGNYDLRLPADKMQLFLANKYVILNECVQLLLGDNPVPPSNQVTYPTQKNAKKKRS
ncbi:MAG: lytic transglycosylase domain-containing protein [Chitinophagaceae bacterium]|nr:lytic transglycosylase domain-containing protein [Chitinophagaceae bacterium]